MQQRHSLLVKALMLQLFIALPSSATEQEKKRTVFFTFDAASSAYLDTLEKKGALNRNNFFQKATRDGFKANKLVPIEVANTGPSHAAIYSGAKPNTSGFVAHSFTTPEHTLPSGTNAFQYISDAETIVSTARKAGKRVACIIAPGLDGRAAHYDCDYMLAFSPTKGPSQLLSLVPAEENSTEIAAQPESWEYSRTLTLETQTPAAEKAIYTYGAQLILADTQKDDTLRYDSVYIAQGGQDPRLIQPVKFLALERISEGKRHRTNIWLNSLDTKTNQVSLYWGQEFPTSVSPNMEPIIEQIGAWPGSLDAKGKHLGRIGDEGFQAHLELYSEYIFDAAQALLAKNDWDLMVAYVPYLDSLQHEYMVTSPKQLAFKEKSNEYRNIIDQAYNRIDGWITKLVEAPEAADVNFIVASDHGMVPTHTTLAIKNLLKSWGYNLGPENVELAVFTSGASANIYVNTEDRKGGIIKQSQKAAILKDLHQRFSSLKSADGETIFQMIAMENTLNNLALDHADNGADLFISATAGFGLDPRISPTSRIFYPSTFNRQLLEKTDLTKAEIEYVLNGTANRISPGVHGHISGTPGIDGIFYAYGPDIPKGLVESIHMLQVTPTLACILGVQPPATATYKAPEQFCEQ